MSTTNQQSRRWVLLASILIFSLLFSSQPHAALAQQPPPNSDQANRLLLPLVQNNGDAPSTDAPVNSPFDDGPSNPSNPNEDGLELPTDSEYEDANIGGNELQALPDAEPQADLPDESTDEEDPAPLIVGGIPSHSGQFPFIVSTRFNGAHICGGSLIGEKWVLTADHCYWDAAAINISVAVGGLRIDGSDASQIIPVARTHRYPNSLLNGHNPIGERDIMILELAYPAQLNSRVQLVSYNRDINFGHSGTSTAIGWGATCSNCPGSLNQLYVDMPINGVFGPQGIYVGADFSNQTTCFGDSGGPYIKNGILFGVTSGTTAPFCTGGAIVTDVAKHVAWIEQVIGGNGSGPGPIPSPSPTNVPPAPTPFPNPTAPAPQPTAEPQPYCESGHVCMIESPNFDYNSGSSIYFQSNNIGRWHDLTQMAHFDGRTWANRLSSAINSTPYEAIISGHRAGNRYSVLRLKPGENVAQLGLLDNEVDYVYLCPQPNCNPTPPRQPAPEMIQLGFESDDEWTETPHSRFTGTSLWRSKTGIAKPKSGSQAQSISNLAYGYLMSDMIPVSPNSTYDLSAYIRGEADAQSSHGWWLMRVIYYDGSGTAIKSETIAYDDIATLTKTWQQEKGRFISPAGTAHIKVGLYGTYFSGWVAFDDLTLTKAGSNTNLIPNPGFESTGGWNETAAQNFPATSLIRHKYRIAVPRSGTYAYAISNLAHGRLESSPVRVAAGQTYELEAHMRSEVNAVGSEASTILRVAFYNSAGAYIGYNNVRWDKPESGSTTWSKYGGTFTTPAGTAMVKVQLYAIYVDGWVAFDDVSLKAVGTTTNLISDGGFEGSSVWKGVRWSQFPGTSSLRHKYRIARPRSGSYGFAISNLAYGNVQSKSLQALPNTTLTINAQIRGEAEAQSSDGVVWLRVSYYGADGKRISFSDIGQTNPVSLRQSWQQVGGNVTTPAGTAFIRIQIYGSYFDGWVAMDDVTIQ